MNTSSTSVGDEKRMKFWISGIASKGNHIATPSCGLSLSYHIGIAECDLPQTLKDGNLENSDEL